jgi:hypothetical protein
VIFAILNNELLRRIKAVLAGNEFLEVPISKSVLVKPILRSKATVVQNRFSYFGLIP